MLTAFMLRTGIAAWLRQGLSWRRCVAILITFHFAVLLWLGLSRHWGYMTSINDLGVFDQAVWGLLHGKPFLNTIVQFNQPTNWLGIHFQPVLALFAPLYLIAPLPEWFALAQALSLSVAAWPIFLLASRANTSEAAGALWAAAYLANPFLLNAAAWDFHPVALAVPLIALGFLAVERREPFRLAAICLCLLSVQEQFGLSVAGFGMLWWWRHRDRRLASGLVGVGIGYAGLALGVVMPALSPTHQHVMLSPELGQLSRYAWLGNSPQEMLVGLVSHPFQVTKTVFWDFQGALYLGLLVVPFLGIPLAGLPFLLPGIGDLAANLLSANGMPRGWESYHSVTLVPVLTVAAIIGVRRLAACQGRFSAVELSGLVAVASIVLGYISAPLPLPAAANFWQPAVAAPLPDPIVPEIRKVISGDASISVQANVGAHFSQRASIFIFPAELAEADIVVLRLDSPTGRLHPDQSFFVGTLAHHLQMRPDELLDTLESLLADRQYQVRVWRDPWLVLSRTGGSGRPADLSEIRNRIHGLRRLWSASGGTAGTPAP